MIPREEWEWFGTPGHFICSQWCRFHLCTKVGKYLISTIGEYIHPRHSNGNERDEGKWLKDNWPGEDIGFGRKYETMVFLAGAPCTCPDCNCGLPNIDGSEIDMAGYNDRRSANNGHIAMCEKYAESAK